MRLSVVVCLLLAACGPSQEAKPIEIVNIPQPASSAKPMPIAVTTSEPPPETPGNAVTTGGPSVAKRDPRKLTTKEGEVDQLKTLLDSTSKSAPDRPSVLRHLGDAAEALARANAANGGDGATPRRQSIDAYQALVNDYPNYSQRDEAHYYLALEYELANDMKNARSQYYNLIKDSPNSKFIPHAYFAFGELFFQEAKTDPSKLDLAQQAYTETTKYPAQNNPLFAFSLYRMGHIAKQKGDAARSQQYFSRLDREFKDTEEAKLPR